MFSIAGVHASQSHSPFAPLPLPGGLAISARNAEYSNSLRAQQIEPHLDGSEAILTAYVVRDGVVRVLGGDRRQIVEIETEAITSSDDFDAHTPSRVQKAGIRLTIYSREEGEDDVESPTLAHHQFVYGERLRFTAKLREPRNFGNPGAWDYRGYLAGRGVTALPRCAPIASNCSPVSAARARDCGRARRDATFCRMCIRCGRVPRRAA